MAVAARARARRPAVGRAPVRRPAVALADDTRRSERREKASADRAAVPGVTRPTAAGIRSPRALVTGETGAADPAGAAVLADMARWVRRAARAADQARAADRARAADQA